MVQHGPTTGGLSQPTLQGAPQHGPLHVPELMIRVEAAREIQMSPPKACLLAWVLLKHWVVATRAAPLIPKWAAIKVMNPNRDGDRTYLTPPTHLLLVILPFLLLIPPIQCMNSTILKKGLIIKEWWLLGWWIVIVPFVFFRIIKKLKPNNDPIIQQLTHPYIWILIP